MKAKLVFLQRGLIASLVGGLLLGSATQAKTVEYASEKFPRQIDLSVGLGTPEVLAGQVQKAYLRVSLEGMYKDPLETRIPVNVAFVLDRSGSMDGAKIENMRRAVHTAIDMLDANDIVSVVTYNQRVQVLMPATKLTNPRRVHQLVDRIYADGNTGLFAGVSQGGAEIRKFLSDGRVNRVILLSDGLANVGPTTPSSLGRLGASLGREGMSVTTIGLGLDYNEDLMVELAGRSDGNHIFAEEWANLAQIFRSEFNDVLAVVAQDIDVRVQLKAGVRPLRVIGRNAEITGRRVHTRLNQIYSEQSKFLVLEVELPAGEIGESREFAQVDVDYTDMFTGRREYESSSAIVTYVASNREVEEASDREVISSAVELEVNEYSKKAVTLRDKGLVNEAQQELEKAEGVVTDYYSILPPSASSSFNYDISKDAEAIEDEQNWKLNRKVLKEKQFKRENQQKD